MCVGSRCPELSLWPSREAGRFCLGREGSFALLGLRRQHPEPPGSGRCLGPFQGWEEALMEATADYREAVPGARAKLITVLRIMLTAWIANRLQLQAMEAIENLK